MSREISIFADYHQRENSLTNYCGLLMKLLYEDNPKNFEELLTTLIETDVNIFVGPKFSQQTKQQNSIPDLAIIQKSFSIFFETKTTDWFYKDQIERHINGFSSDSETKILFLLSNFDTNNLEERFEEEIKKAKKSNVIVQPITFEDFVGSIEKVSKSEYLLKLLDEFKLYLDRNGHLPKWKYLLDVVNCKGTLNEIREGVYMCPDTGGPYSHRRAKYFGPYANKKVSEIWEIKAIVVVDKGCTDIKIKWNNSDEKDTDLKNQAKEKIENWDYRIKENESVPLQVFLLENRVETNFIKDSSGGMQQSKKYFWDIALDCSNSNELAEKLMNKNWSEM